jgi:hypothetical protein
MPEKSSLKEVVWNQFIRSRDFYSDEHHNIEKWDKYWESSPDVVKVSEDWEERIHVPMTFDAEQVLTPRVHSVITATNPPFDVVGVEQQDEKSAIPIKHLIGHQFELSKFETKSIAYIRQAAIRGTTIAEVFWHRKERYLTTNEMEEVDEVVEDPITKKDIVVATTLQKMKRTKMTTVKNHADFEVWSVLDAFPDPDAIDFDDDLPFIRRQKISIDKLKEWNKVAEDLGMDTFDYLNELEKEILEKSKVTGKELTQAQMNIYLLHYYGLVDLSSYGVEVEGKLEGKSVPAWITVGYTDEDDESIEGKYVMRAIRNPYWHGRPPFVKSVWTTKKMPSFFGVGIAEAGQSSADRINKIVNMRMDNIKRIINKRFYYNINDTYLDMNAAESGEPGRGIGMSDINASMKWEDTPDVTQSSYLEEQQAKDDFRQATGAVAAISPGKKGEQHQTVRGMMLLQGQAGERLKIISTNIEETFNKQLAQMYFELIKQYMNEEEVFDIVNEEGAIVVQTVTPEEVLRKVNFRTTGVTEVVNREMQINQLMQFKQYTLEDITINKAEINKRIAILFGFKDLDKLIREVTPEQEIAMRQALGGGGGGGGPAPNRPRPMPNPEGAGRPATDQLGFEKAEDQLKVSGGNRG